VTLAAIVAHATALRRALHREPELMHREHDTAALVRGELDRVGIAWRACAGTGTVARIGPGVGRHLAFRADLDALPLAELSGVAWASRRPGLMHACGHDGHTASLLAAAAWLKTRERDLRGPVTLLFQPAEEGGHGAQAMCADGALDGVDAVYGYHNWPAIPFGRAACPPGPVMGANAEWTATITGRGGHASAPHLAVDPIVAGAHFVTLAQQIVARQVAPQSAAVVTVTCFHAGTADNIIPETAELIGTVRAATTTTRDDLARRVEACLHAACAASGAVGSFDYRPCYPATVNDPDQARLVAAAARRVLGPGAIDDTGMPLMAAEDFGYFLTKCPGAFILLGAGRPGQPIEGCHSPRFDFNDELIPVVVRLWADLAGVPVAGS